MLTRIFLLVLSSCFIVTATRSIAQSQSTQPVTLRFAGAVNGAPFACGKSYPNIGTTKSTITPSDFRLFVSAMELLTNEGKAVPVALNQDGVWQYKNIALVDFEDGSGPCSNGTKATHTEVTGSCTGRELYRLALHHGCALRTEPRRPNCGVFAAQHHGDVLELAGRLQIPEGRYDKHGPGGKAGHEKHGHGAWGQGRAWS